MIGPAQTVAVLVGALLLDATIGDPDRIWRSWPHPAVWMGTLVAALDRHLNRPAWSERSRRLAGCGALAIAVIVALGVAAAIQKTLLALPGGAWWLAAVASILIAARSLHDHVARVRDAFADGLPAARRAVSMIVGRDPNRLDEAGVSRAAIESAAENFSDGVVAPAFWFAVAGLPGLATYKMINTADSMIGHLSERHRAFGWAAARTDDLVNLVPARLAGLLVAIAAPVAGGRIAHALTVMLRDHAIHRSPNAGWPESAMAGALGLALAGPRVYAAGPVDEPFLNPDGRRDAGPDDIRRALRVMIAAAGLQVAAYAALTLALMAL